MEVLQRWLKVEVKLEVDGYELYGMGVIPVSMQDTSNLQCRLHAGVVVC